MFSIKEIFFFLNIFHFIKPNGQGTEDLKVYIKAQYIKLNRKENILMR